MKNNITSTIRRIADIGDLFSIPVTFTLMNKERFTTKSGIICSVVIYIMLFGFFIYVMATPLNFEDSEYITSSTSSSSSQSTSSSPSQSTSSSNFESKILTYKDTNSMNSDSTIPTSFTPFDNSNQTGVPFAISFSAGIDKSVASLEVYLKQNPNGGLNPTLKKIDLALCNSTLFTYSNWTEAVKYGIDKFYCLTDKSISLNRLQDSIEIYAKTCNGTSCKTTTDLTNALYGGYIQFAFIESNSDSYKNAKASSQYINLDNYIMIGPTFYAYTEINLKYNKVTTTSNTVFNYFSTERTINQNQPMSSTNNIVFKTVLKFSATYNSYSQMQVYYSNHSRRHLEAASGSHWVFKFLFSLALTGGFYSVLYALMKPILNCFAIKFYKGKNILSFFC